MTELNLAKYITSPQYCSSGLRDRENGLKAAKDYDVVNLTGPIVLVIPQGIRMDSRFLKALLGPLARKVGPENVEITVQGGFRDCDNNDNAFYHRFPPAQEQVDEYLAEESIRMAQRAEKKTKAAQGPTWSKPIQFFVPEISTVLCLTVDWKFRLYTERRNDGLTGMLGIKTNRSWLYDSGSITDEDVTMKAGAVLKVSRVYIRQGGKEYSSLTFNVTKGAVMIVKGKKVVLHRNARFWAKLSDVNNMCVKVDTETLAEN